MVEPESTDGKHGGRVPGGVTGAAPVPRDARSDRAQCNPKAHDIHVNEVPRDCRSAAIGDIPFGLHAAGWLRTFVLLRFTLDVPLDKFRHEDSERDSRGLRWLIEEDNAAGLPHATVPKLRRMLSFLQDMKREDELRTVPARNAHGLPGDRRCVWSLAVTRNWRLTFRIDRAECEIVDLGFEDYGQETLSKLPPPVLSHHSCSNP